MELQNSEIYGILLRQNPWIHGAPTVPDGLAPPAERFLVAHLAARLQKGDLPRHHAVLGPRRSGKTTLMYQVVQRLLKEGTRPEKIWWARVDHPALAHIPLGELVNALMDLASVSQEEPLHLFLDELVYAREWDLWLKTFHDERWPVRVLANSSATAALHQGRVESGVGRWEEWSLPPCGLVEALALDDVRVDAAPARSLRESLEMLARGTPHPPDLDVVRRRLVFLGGFPEFLVQAAKSSKDGELDPALIREAQQRIRSDAVERAIYKDLMQSFRIQDPMVVERLLYILAGQVTGLLSPRSLAGSIPDVKTPTLERYLGHLGQAWLVFTLLNYAPSEEAVQRRGRKVYFIDGAVRNATLQLDVGVIGEPDQLGRLHENLAAAHLRSLGERSGVRVYHWRHRQNEVDLVYDDPNGPLAFEIGSAPTHGRSGILRFLEDHPRFRGGCYYVAPSLPFRAAAATEMGIGELPLDMLLLAMGMQERAALERRFGG